MGKIIHDILLKRGHNISLIIDQHNPSDLRNLSADTTDVAIEFSRPEAAVDNINACLEQGIPVLSGTTGWLEHLPSIEDRVKHKNGTFFYASNYSIGVNLFFALNKHLSRIMSEYENYGVEMTETHHTEKLDQPSGTAITLAEGILENYPKKQHWVNSKVEDKEKLGIISERLPNVPGTHAVSYTSSEDTIEITHKAHSRMGFAMGAVHVAEWLKEKKGFLSMEDYLKIKS